MGFLATSQETASAHGGVVKLPWYAINSCSRDRTISFILNPEDMPLIDTDAPTSLIWSRFFRKLIPSAWETYNRSNKKYKVLNYSEWISHPPDPPRIEIQARPVHLGNLWHLGRLCT